MTWTGRSPSSRFGTSVVVTAVCAAVGVATTSPTPASAAPLFFVKVQSQGSFVADYGEDRHTSGTRGFGTDGQERMSWKWEVQAVGRPTRQGLEFKSQASRFRAVAFHDSNLVEYDHLGGPSGGQLREFPDCEGSPYANRRRTVDAQDDSEPRPRELSHGAWTDPKALVELADRGGLQIRGIGDATQPPDCLRHGDKHGLRFGNVAFGDAKLPSRAFDSRRSDLVTKTFRDTVDEPLEHSGVAPAYHTAAGTSTLTLYIRRVSRDYYKKLKDEYRDGGEYELHNCGPADPGC